MSKNRDDSSSRRRLLPVNLYSVSIVVMVLILLYANKDIETRAPIHCQADGETILSN